MLKINDLAFSYSGNGCKVFNDFSLEFEKGAVYGLLGKNGTGKSTLLYLITGLLHPQQGTVLFKDEEVRRRLPSTLSDMYIVPEEFELPSMTMKQYVKLNAPFYPNFSEEQLTQNLALFDFDENIHLGNLSMGQKKKAYMCFALAANTSLLVMDEPTNGLDIPSKSEFRRLIASNMTDEKTIIISTHQVRDIDSLLDHIVIIDQSSVLLNASNADICRRLLFTELPMSEPTDGALYVQPSVSGNSAILPNEYDEESRMNLELLFNGVLAEREKFAQVFNR
ncbi:MAG: ABC transporter ATP-binding protein [Bacteroidaceae bacterium]|nr:ABC transporter ATP-binding protein [Bacteroidaceae bacterium]